MRWITKTFHTSAAAPDPLADFGISFVSPPIKTVASGARGGGSQKMTCGFNWSFSVDLVVLPPGCHVQKYRISTFKFFTAIYSHKEGVWRWGGLNPVRAQPGLSVTEGTQRLIWAITHSQTAKQRGTVGHRMTCDPSDDLTPHPPNTRGQCLGWSHSQGLAPPSPSSWLLFGANLNVLNAQVDNNIITHTHTQTLLRKRKTKISDIKLVFSFLWNTMISFFLLSWVNGGKFNPPEPPGVSCISQTDSRVPVCTLPFNNYNSRAQTKAGRPSSVPKAFYSDPSKEI